MMKKLLLVFLFFGSSLIYGQSGFKSIEISEPVKWEYMWNTFGIDYHKHQYPSSVLLKDSTGTYVYFRKSVTGTDGSIGEKLHYQDLLQPEGNKYDKTENLPVLHNLLKVSEGGNSGLVELEFPKSIGGSPFYPKSILSFGMKLYVIGNLVLSSNTNNTPSSQSVVLYEIDKSNFSVNTDNKIIIGDLEYLNFKSFNQMPYGFKISPDHSKLAFIEFGPIKKKQDSKVKYKVFNSDFELLYEFSRTEKLKNQDGAYRMIEYQVNNEGAIIEVGLLDKSTDNLGRYNYDYLIKNREKSDKFSYLIRIYNSDTDKIMTENVDYFIANPKIEILPSGRIVVIGCNAKSAINVNSKSFTFSLIDPANYSIINHAFDLNETSIATYDNYRSKRGTSVYYLSDPNIVEDSSNNIYVVLNQSSACYDCVGQNYFNIIALKINPQYVIEWESSISRALLSELDMNVNGFSQSMIINDHLTVLFNDNPENHNKSDLSIDDIKWINKGDEGVCTMAMFNRDGTYSRWSAFDRPSIDLSMHWLVTPLYHSTENMGTIFVSGGKGMRMITILDK